MKDRITITSPAWKSIQRQCINAVQAIHHLHIIHRNISPYAFHIKETRNGLHVVLNDFYDAIEDTQQEKTILVGIKGYAAPEMALGVTSYSNKIDWYALGITFLIFENPAFAAYYTRLLGSSIIDLQIHNQIYPFKDDTFNNINPDMPLKARSYIFSQLQLEMKPKFDIPPLVKGLCQTMADDRWGDDTILDHFQTFSSSSWQRLVKTMRTFIRKEGERE